MVLSSPGRRSVRTIEGRLPPWPERMRPIGARGLCTATRGPRCAARPGESSAPAQGVRIAGRCAARVVPATNQGAPEVSPVSPRQRRAMHRRHAVPHPRDRACRSHFRGLVSLNPGGGQPNCSSRRSKRRSGGLRARARARRPAAASRPASASSLSSRPASASSLSSRPRTPRSRLRQLRGVRLGPRRWARARPQPGTVGRVLVHADLRSAQVAPEIPPEKNAAFVAAMEDVLDV